MLRRHLQKIGSILGLLAILMTTLAPTVSQALLAHDRLDVALSDRCAAQASPVSGDALTADQDMRNMHGPDPQALHWQACGYCGLLAHFPIVPPVPMVFAVRAAFAHSITVHAGVEIPFTAPVLSAQPRAPPLAVL